MSGHACCAPTGAAVESAPEARAQAKPAYSAAAGRRLRRAMLELPGGVFEMGSEDADVNPGDAEGPIRQVEVAPFLISATTVTNAEFERFVKETGYRTEAERQGWSFVFHLFLSGIAREHLRGSAGGAPWWIGVDGADWRHPEGHESSLFQRRDHPVVHVSHDDARAYCAWSGTRLPSEAEWEYAARGGLVRQRYAWGDELTPGGMHRCNIWQGQFPHTNTAEDGYAGTAPAKSFPANGYGLYNVAGNVWEWTGSLWDPAQDGTWAMRGGSYLCHDSYCNRYRVAARTQNTADSSSGNCGFRVAADVAGEAQ